MPKKVQDRLSWAIKVMKIKPKSSVAEIGCGDGSAIEVLLSNVKSTSVFAIDKSAIAITKAKRRLKDKTKVRLIKRSLGQGVFEGKTFNVIYCFNVNLFWTDPLGEAGEYKEIHTSLKQKGVIYLFYQIPDKKPDQKIIDRLKSNMTKNGFNFSKTDMHKETGSFFCAFKK